MDVGQKGLSRHHGDVLIWKTSGVLLSEGRRRGGWLAGWGLPWLHCLAEETRVNCVHATQGVAAWLPGWLPEKRAGGTELGWTLLERSKFGSQKRKNCSPPSSADPKATVGF